MMSVLNTIVKHKKKEVESCKNLIPVPELLKMTCFERNTYKLTDFILSQEKTGIIAEFKRKSPSRGIINNISQVENVTAGYTENGASALSVLTDFIFFGGSVDDLRKARNVNNIPILRKEFIIDEYQVYEAKAIGADAILLIASILDKDQTKTLAKKARELGLQVLMEIHEEQELNTLNDYLDVVGINNRNLKTFEVDLQQSVKLVKKIPDDFVKISESGITSADDLLYLSENGFSGFLIGEYFMKTSDPVIAFADFVDEVNTKKER
ncbi:MAG: indole-3-glycerol phosphate synthase TrpC [Bacteroidales bacterium]|nr:indole-3-glycerol phosphate synthase TrpC [Bacteroidales bacterium]